MAKRGLLDDDTVAEVSGADQQTFTSSKRRQLEEASDASDAGDVSNSVVAEVHGEGDEHGAEAVAADDMMMAGDAMDTNADAGDDGGNGVEATADTYVDQGEETDEDESDAFRTDLELNAVFADHHHHANANEGGDVPAAGAEPESEETIEPMQVDHPSVNAPADNYNPATNAVETSDLASTPMVIAPMFPPVHRSWEAFEQSLKEYAHATFQQYVVRTTTSVKRRNQRITENASSSTSSSFLPVGASSVDPVRGAQQGDEGDQNADATAQDASVDEQPEPADEDTSSTSALVSADSGNQAAPPLSEETVTQHQQLIPETYRWYSKTLMCTHGWKDRNRGSGKRSLSVVRSTSCPAKMCVTLQHRGKGDDGWQVVLTRHVRTHNHQLSKELYLYYMENRRIYDPDLLQVSGSPSMSLSPAPAQQQQPQQQRSKGGLSHLLASIEDQQRQPLQFTGNTRDVVAPNGFQAPRALVKSHESWELFHNYVAEYSTLSNQSFRSRSTVSVVAKNLKTKTLAFKAGRSAEEIAAQLIPESERWYSKMLICNHGWKRKSRSKAQKNISATTNHQDDELSLENSCPVMLMARLQRDVNDSWRVVINRQILDHNHSPLRLVVADGSSAAPPAGQIPASSSASVVDQQQQQQESNSQQSTLHYLGGNLATGSLSESQQDHLTNGEAREQPPGFSQQQQQLEKGEIVVRVPKLEAVHVSWEAFHARLQEYSDASFQLYRTRTTSSVQGRNQKIPDMKRSSSFDDLALGEAGSTTSQTPTDTRTIPDEWKWYSKTLTCTHGWKERRRGTGKRTVQVFRSTACPVKICATVQFVENAHSEDGDGSAAGNDTNRGGGSWRVVVTKHVVDHNHNLSKELHQHYCENRRIYDPDLLTIDESNASVVTKPRKILHQHHQHNNFLLGNPDDQQAFQQQQNGAAAAMDATSTGATGMHHPFGLLGDASLHSVGHTSSNSGGHDFHSGTGDDGSFVTHPSAPSTSGLSASLSSFSGAFPSLAGSHALFRTASHLQQNPPFLLHAHQYFAVDQSMNLGFAASQFHMPTIGNPGIRESSNAPSFAAGNSSSSSFLAVPCRVHGGGGVGFQIAQRLSDSNQQCTCFRGANAIATKPPSAQPLQRTTAPSSVPVHSAAKQKRSTDQRVLQDDDHHQQHQHDDFDNDGGEDEDESSPPGGATAVWGPTMDPEILTLTSVSGMTFYRAPKIKRLHATWDEFQEHLEAYSVATYQLFRVRTTSSVSSRNTRIAQQAVDRDAPTLVGASEGAAADLPAPSPLLVPESYQWYSKTFVCTHGWKSRSRGKGQRKSHNLRSTACPAKLCVTLQRVLHETNRWHVVVTRQGTDHNHEISVAAYQQYSEVRRIRDASLLEQAEELWKKGMTRRKVFEFLKEQAPNILMKDVHNLVQRWQTRYDKANNDAGASESVSAHENTSMAVEAEVVAQPAVLPATEASQKDTSMQQHELQGV